MTILIYISYNVGLEKWERERQKWLNYSNNSSSVPISSEDHQRCLPSSKKKKLGAVALNVDHIIELIISNQWKLAAKGGAKEKEKATFEKPVPLPQLVDILVDLWEAEGMS